MKAAVYFGPEDIRCTDIDDARLDDSHSMLVEVVGTSICGSDLHLYRGAMDPIMERGRSQTGHELVGRVVDVGEHVGRFVSGDRVTMAYSASCGHCYLCSVGQTAHCETTQKAVYGFGTGFGDLNGTHAEALVIPHADAHAMLVPEGISDEAAVSLSCNLPSAVIANQLASIQPGESLALIGCGPTGLMALDIAIGSHPSPLVAIDPVEHRRNAAAAKGALAVDPSKEGWLEETLALTGGRGFDKVIEMVGYTDSLQSALDLIRPGGTVAALGVFTDPEFNLNLADVFLRDISLHMNGFANVQPFMWDALRLLERGVVKPEEYVNRRFSLEDIADAFSTFQAKSDGINKVLIVP